CARAGGERRACCGWRGSALHRYARAPGWAGAGGAAGGRGAGPTAADRALLRGRDRVARRGPVGLAAPRHGRLVGRRGGDKMIRRVLDIAVSSAALVLSAPVLALAMLAIRLE